MASLSAALVHHAKRSGEGELGSVWFSWVVMGWRPGVWVVVAARPLVAAWGSRLAQTPLPRVLGLHAWSPNRRCGEYDILPPQEAGSVIWRHHLLWYLHRRTEKLQEQCSPEVPNFLARELVGAYILKRSWRRTEVARLGGGNGFVRVRR